MEELRCQWVIFDVLVFIDGRLYPTKQSPFQPTELRSIVASGDRRSPRLRKISENSSNHNRPTRVSEKHGYTIENAPFQRLHNESSVQSRRLCCLDHRYLLRLPH